MGGRGMSTATTAIPTGAVVQVYRNIHRSRAAGHPVYSIRSKATGRVIGHGDRIVLADAEFIVSEAGRQRVIREQAKNVHAFAEGVLTDLSIGEETATITYNPYRFATFVDADTLEPVHRADLVELAVKVRARGIEGERA